jgi:hypothetical protein
MDLRKSLVDALRAILVIVFPMFASPRERRRVHPLLLVVLHATLVAGTIAGLWWIQNRQKLDRFLELPSPQFRNLWLPLLFVLVYLLSWAGRWVFSLLARDEESPVCPDLDKAWREAVQALATGRLDALTAFGLRAVHRPRAEGRRTRSRPPLRAR